MKKEVDIWTVINGEIREIKIDDELVTVEKKKQETEQKTLDPHSDRVSARPAGDPRRREHAAALGFGTRGNSRTRASGTGSAARTVRGAGERDCPRHRSYARPDRP